MTTWVNSQFPQPDFHRQVQRHYGLQTQILTLSDPKIRGQEPKTLSKRAHNPLLKEAGPTKFCTGRTDGRGLEDPRAQRTTVLEITPRTSLYLTHFSPLLDERPVEKVEILEEFNSRKKPLFWFDFPL